MNHDKRLVSLFLFTLSAGCTSGKSDNNLVSATGTPDAPPDSSISGSTGTPEPTDSQTTGADSEGSGSTRGNPPLEEDTETSTVGEATDCIDALILDLGFVQGTTSSGEVTNASDNNDWVSTIDATAGGLPNAAMNPWVYMRFTSDGLIRVDIDDYDALESLEWHIATKRFGIRLNSGDSGPSTVTAAAVLNEDYANVSELPTDVILQDEAIYTESCEIIGDGSGVGAPGYVMTPWWSYPGCVATTGTPFVVELPERGRLKLVVDAYYGSGQSACNDSGEMGSNSANFTWRWAFFE